jgi:hypothetical protein
MAQVADSNPMEHEYQNMGVDERMRHHDELSEEGYEWCPECGEALVWDLPVRSKPDCASSRAPIVTGDCPPLTRDQLLVTTPAS